MKKATYLIFLLIISSLFTFQDGKSQGWQVGYLFQPQLSSLGTNDNSLVNSVEVNQTFTAYTGLSATYFFSDKLGLGTGISYGHEAQKFIYQPSVSGPQNSRTSNHYVFKLLRFPLALNFKKKLGKISLLVDGGPLFSYVLSVKNKTSLGTFDYTENYSSFQVGLQMATGVGIQLNDAFMVFIKPTFQVSNFSFNHTVENIDQTYPLGKSLTGQSFGLQLGVMWMKSGAAPNTN